MSSANPPTEEEYRCLLAQDLADDPGNPWRVERTHREPPPVARQQILGQRAQWKGHHWPIAPALYCQACQRLGHSCVCPPPYSRQ